MACPVIADLLQFVSADVQVVEFGTLKSWPLTELVVRNVEPLQVRESFFLSKDSSALDPIVCEIQASQSCTNIQATDIRKPIVRKVQHCDILDLLGCLRQLLQLLADTGHFCELKALFVR